MDDLDNDLFTSSLSRNRRPRSRSNRQQTERKVQPAVAGKRENKPEVEVQNTEQPKTEKKKPSKSFFDDIDDPFAGILSSDEEEKDVKRKGGRGGGNKSTIGKTISETSEEKVGSDTETDMTRQSLVTQMSPQLRRAALGDTETDSPGKTKEPNPFSTTKSKVEFAFKPVSKEKQDGSLPFSSKSKSKAIDSDDNFSDDGDLLDNLGFDSESPGKQPASTKVNQKLGDILGKSSKFDELMGKSESAQELLQTGKSDKVERPNTRGKKQLEPHQETEPSKNDDFQFGGYTPSVGNSDKSRRQSLGVRQRPSTAPTSGTVSKSVRFADELGLELDEETNISQVATERPSSSPAKVMGKSQQRATETVEQEDGQAMIMPKQRLEMDVSDKESSTTVPGPPSSKNSSTGFDVLSLGQEGDKDNDPKNETDHGISTTLGDDLFGGDLGLEPTSGQRPLTGRRRAQEEKPLFPWEMSTSRPPARRHRPMPTTLSDKTSSSVLKSNSSTATQHSQSTHVDPVQFQALQQPTTTVAESISTPVVSTQPEISSLFPTTDQHQPDITQSFRVSQQLQAQQIEQQPLSVTNLTSSTLQPVFPVPSLTSVVPSQLSGLGSVSGVTLSLSHPEASAVAIANATAEGRQAVLREEIEKLRNETKALKTRVSELETQCLEHERQKQTWLEEKGLLSQQLEAKEEEKQQVSRERKQQETELETKIHIAEVEKKQLQEAIKAASNRHKQELDNMEILHNQRIQGMEESFQRQESRLRDEIEKQAAEHNNRVIELEKAKSSTVTAYERKLADVDKEHLEAIERLKETHRQLIEELKLEQEKDKSRQQKLHQQELAAVAQAHSHTKSLQELISQVHQSTQHVSELQQRVDMSHTEGHQQREQALRIREEQLQSLEERLLRQQSDYEQERSRLHGLIAKMESHVREQTRQIEQDRWKIQQDESRLQAVQRALEHDRITTAETLAREREELQRSREQLLKEQQIVLSQCYAERRGLAEERSQLSVTQRRCHQQEQEATAKSIQLEDELKSELESIQQQSEDLTRSRHKVRNELERLSEEKRQLVINKRSIIDEKGQLEQTRLRLQEKFKEVQQLYVSAAEAREFGKQSLHEAELTRVNVEERASELEAKRQELEEQEKRMAQDRLELARERMNVDRERNNWLQEKSTYFSQQNSTLFTTTPFPPCPRDTFTPSLRAQMSHPSTHKSVQGITAQDTTSGQQASQLIAQLEYNRALRLWTDANEKQIEELHEESDFLDGLEMSRTSNKTVIP
jgi:Fas-binding factor 1